MSINLFRGVICVRFRVFADHVEMNVYTSAQTMQDSVKIALFFSSYGLDVINLWK